MSQRYFQELHNTLSSPERGRVTRVSMRAYVHTLKARCQSMAKSHLSEFLAEVFSAEGASRFFKTFLQRFLSDANKSGGDDSMSNTGAFRYAFVRIQP